MNISQRNEIAARPGSDMKNTQINNYGTFTYCLLNINLSSKIHFVRMSHFKHLQAPLIYANSKQRQNIVLSKYSLTTNKSSELRKYHYAIGKNKIEIQFSTR